MIFSVIQSTICYKTTIYYLSCLESLWELYIEICSSMHILLTLLSVSEHKTEQVKIVKEKVHLKYRPLELISVQTREKTPKHFKKSDTYDNDCRQFKQLCYICSMVHSQWSFRFISDNETE